jgi:hypothetical protein
MAAAMPRPSKSVRLFVFSCAMVLTASLRGAQNEPSEKTIRLRLPDGVDLTDLSIRYLLTGPFGGYGGSGRVDPSVREQSISTWQGGQPGKSIKVIIYNPGYGFRLFAEPDLAARRIGTLTIELEPLGTLFLGGRISGLPAVQGLIVEAGYFTDWECRFFDLADCLQGSMTVARSNIAVDGTFTLNIPDFLRDPVVARYPEHGSLVLRVNGTIDFQLQDAQKLGQGVRIPIASSYSGTLQLVAVRH